MPPRSRHRAQFRRMQLFADNGAVAPPAFCELFDAKICDCATQRATFDNFLFARHETDNKE